MAAVVDTEVEEEAMAAEEVDTAEEVVVTEVEEVALAVRNNTHVLGRFHHCSCQCFSGSGGYGSGGYGGGGGGGGYGGGSFGGMS